MNSSLDLYYIFYIVAKEGSISKASSLLFVSQPAITLQIKKLEQNLNISLFTRTKHGMVLTDEGRVLFEYVKSGINNIVNGENALASLKKLDTGTVRIGVSTTLCRYVLMPYLKRFHEMYPNIDIQINNNTSTNLIKELRNGNLDVLLMFSPLSENKDLMLTPIKQVQDIFVSNKKYYDLINNKNILNEFDSYPIILPNSLSNSRVFLDKYLKENNININPKLEVVSYNLIVDLIKTGFGIGFVTKEFIEDELNNKSLYELNIKPSIPKRTIVVATIEKKEPNYCTQKLIELIKENRIN